MFIEEEHTQYCSGFHIFTKFFSAMPGKKLLLFTFTLIMVLTPVVSNKPTAIINYGTADAAYSLLERVLPGSSAHFHLSLSNLSCASNVESPCFAVSDGSGGSIDIVGTTASELTAAIGFYFREMCNMTIGWPRGGGSNIFTPAAWPVIGAIPYARQRNVPFSYIMNVCTHRYDHCLFFKK